MKNVRVKAGFGMVSNTVIRDPDISLKEKAIYAYLSSYADRVHNECTVGIDRMAAECGVDHSTIKRTLKTLVDKGIITRISRGINKTSITILLK
jgi:DNA-binding MarR family transcriptional regulator